MRSKEQLTIQKKYFNKWWKVLLLIFSGVLLNGLFSFINYSVSSPIFMDSIFTAVAAAVAGPLAGILTGLFTNIFVEIIHGFTGEHFPFALCNMATGLIVGIAAKKGLFNTLLQMTVTVIIVTLANSIIGSIVAVFVYGGITGAYIDYIVSTLVHAGNSILSSAFLARIPANLIDKLIAVQIAFWIRKALLKNKQEIA